MRFFANKNAAEPLSRYLQRMLIICVTPLIAVIALMTLDTIGRIHETQQAAVQATADQIAQTVDAELERHLHGLLSVATQSAFFRALKPEKPEALYPLLRAYDEAFTAPIFLVDAQRNVLLHSRKPLGSPLPTMHLLPAKTWHEAALNSGLAKVSDRVYGPILQKQLVVLFQPIQDAKPPLMLASPLTADHFEVVLQRQRIPAGWTVALIDSARQRIAQVGAEQESVPTADLQSAREHLATLQHTPWRVVVRASASSFYAPHLKLASLWLIGLATVAIGVYLLARRSSRRLQGAAWKLLDTLHCVRSKEVSAQVQVDSTVPRIVEAEMLQLELQRLNAERNSAQERERRRIARELHDGLQQNLASVQINLDMAQQHLADGSALVAGLLHQAYVCSAETISELGHIVNELRPLSLDMLGLSASIEQLANRVSQRCGLDIELDFAGAGYDFEQVPEPVADCVYRVVQECLNNVGKHAKARFVYLLVDASDNRQVVLQISDDGAGIPVNAQRKPDSFGLRSMKERVDALGGWLRVQSPAGHKEFGTSVFAVLPL